MSFFQQSWSLALALASNILVLALASKTTGLGFEHAVLEPIPGEATSTFIYHIPNWLSPKNNRVEPPVSDFFWLSCMLTGGQFTADYKPRAYSSYKLWQFATVSRYADVCWWMNVLSSTASMWVISVAVVCKNFNFCNSVNEIAVSESSFLHEGLWRSSPYKVLFITPNFKRDLTRKFSGHYSHPQRHKRHIVHSITKTKTISC